MKLKLFTVDAFTDKAFAGNPAAVCLTENKLSEEQMKNIAFEMNLAETAYVANSGNHYDLRWFTPDSEVDLCGHATLAASHILWEQNIHDKNLPIEYMTKSGKLTAVKHGNKIELDFPAIEQYECEIPALLIETLGAKPIYLGKTKWNYIAEMDSDDTVRNVKPNFELMNKLETWGTIITARSSLKEFDFISRFFAPGKGINEDPVTGSAHCVLGPYWMKKLGKNKFRAYQASQRGGVLDVKVIGDRVKLSGSAVTVVEGNINL